MEKRLLTLIITIAMVVGLSAQTALLLHYDFADVNDNVVRDLSPSHFDGRLKGSAQAVSEQGSSFVSLGYNGGYVDMGAEVGKRLKTLRDFTVAVRYRVDDKASLEGNGYFLWAFSTLEQNTQSEGRYHAYKLNVQRAENSVGGWSRETTLEIGNPSQKGEWQHVVYTQRGTEGRLFLNGRLEAFNNDMFRMSRTFPREAPTFNWIGRAPFRGDAFLAGTSISDIRLYDGALSENEVKDLSLTLAGEQLSRHDFLFTGEAKSRKIYKLEDGRVMWTYDNPAGKGEISDAILLDDGHIMLADQFGAAELDADGRELWRIAAPEGTEIHTLQPIGTRYVLYILQDIPVAKVIVRRLSDMKIVREFDVPVDPQKKMHFQFRCARLTKAGTLLIAHMGDGGISEYDSKGRLLNKWDVPAPWGVAELENGDILCTTGRSVRQFNRQGQTTWECDLSRFGVTIPQKAYRLPNGNTVVSNWFSEWDNVAISDFDELDPPVQLVEVTPEGKEAWRMASWRNPNLGPATTFQPLDAPMRRSSCRFGKFK